MSATWCRIPSWAGLAVCDERASKRGRAYVYLLSTWHIGNDPGPREIARMAGLGAGLTAKLTAEVVAWAIENGARLPERYSASTGTVAEHSEVDATPEVSEDRNGSGTVLDGYRNISRARALLQEEMRSEQQQENHAHPPDGTDPDRSPERDRHPDPDRQEPAHAGPAPADPGTESNPPPLGPAVTWGKGLPAGMVEAVLTCIGEAKQRPVNPARTGTDAKTVLALWRATGKPDAAGFGDDLRTVIRWARESPDKLAARDIRAEGWEGGTDRHADLSTLCRQDKWSARVDAARKWAAVPPSAPTATPTEDWTEADACRALVAKAIATGAEIDPGDIRLKFLGRRTLRVIGGREVWRGRLNAPDGVARWREEWAASVADMAQRMGNLT